MNTRLTSFFGKVLLATLASVFCFGAVAQADNSCDRDPTTIKLKIKEKNNTPTKITKGIFGSNANTINACRGDTIEWKLSGKTFFVSFSGDTPFSEKKKTSQNGKLRMTIGADAKTGISYQNDVGIDGGGVFDPIIIID